MTGLRPGPAGGKVKRILYWTSGIGTGHIKRANALWRGFRKTGRSVDFYVSAHLSRFPHLLNPSMGRWNGGESSFEAVILDHRLGDLPSELAEMATCFVRLRKIVPPFVINSKPRHALGGTITEISIENARAMESDGLPYLGCLIDADPSELYVPEEAREKIREAAGRELPGKLGLVHINTPFPQAALAFFEKALPALAEKADAVVFSSDHREILPRAVELAEASFPGRSAVCDLNPAYRYYKAFDSAFLPASYNTYCEAKLFFPGDLRVEPATFFDGRLRLIDQRMRAAEIPEVVRIGNEAIARRILELC